MLESTAIDKFDFSKPQQYTLSIRLSADGFSFSVCDTEQDLIFFSGKEVDPAISITANLKRIFRETDFLNHSFGRVTVLMVSNRFTLVPAELHEGDGHTLFRFNHSPKRNEMILNSLPPANETAVTFGIDKSVYNFLTDRFHGAVEFHSPVSLLTAYFSELSRFGDMKKMYACIRGKALDLYCFGEEGLLLVNSFECKKDADRQYYILYSWKQLQFDQERDKLHLIFENREQGELQRELSRFVKDISVPTFEGHYSGDTAGIPLDMRVLLMKGK